MRLPDYMFSPFTYALLLALLLVVMWRRLPRTVRWTGAVIEVLLLVTMTPLGANALVWSVESRVPPPRACVAPVPTTIVVLSGGTDRKPRGTEDYSALNAVSLHRLFAGAALWRQMPGARLVLSGGGYGVPESVLLAGLAERMGVSPGAIQTERRSHTTWENAMYVAALKPSLPRRIWLVSSALHLPRALGAFRVWGFKPCAWSSGSIYVPPHWSIGYFVPQSSALRKANRAIHELIGDMVYRGLEWKLREKQKSPVPAVSLRRQSAGIE